MRDLVGALFVLSVASALGSRLYLFSLLRTKIPNLSFQLAGTPFYLEGMYFRRRRSIGSRRLDFLALAVVVSMAAAIGSAALLIGELSGLDKVPAPIE